MSGCVTVEPMYWLTAAAVRTGVWLNVDKHVACLWIWTVTNAI